MGHVYDAGVRRRRLYLGLVSAVALVAFPSVILAQSRDETPSEAAPPTGSRVPEVPLPWKSGKEPGDVPKGASPDTEAERDDGDSEPFPRGCPKTDRKLELIV